MEKKEVKSKKTKTRELETISDDLASEFKYTDHLVSDPLSIGNLTMGKSVVLASTLKRIDSLTVVKWQSKSKKKEKKKQYKWGDPVDVPLKKAKINQNLYSYDYVPGLKTVKINPLQDKSYERLILDQAYYQKKVTDKQNQIAAGNGITALNGMSIMALNTLLAVDQDQLYRINEELARRNSTIPDLDIDMDEGEVESLTEIKMPSKDWGDPFEQPVVTTANKKMDSLLEEETLKKSTFIDNLLDSLFTFKYHYGGNPAIIKGYIINDKVITTNQEIETLLNSNTYINWESIKTIVRVGNVIDGKIISKIRVIKTYKLTDIGKLDKVLPILPVLLRFKIKDFKNSNSFFENNKSRRILKELDSSTLNWKVELVSISRNKNKHTTYIAVIEHPETKNTTKFVLTDCVFTNLSIVGYNPPLDKTIRVGSIVKVKDNKIERYGIRENTNAKVTLIKVNLSSKKISKDSSNRRMDIVSIRMIPSLRVVNVYAQDLKFIENPKQEYVTAKKEEPKKANLKDYNGEGFQVYQNIWNTTTTTFINRTI